MRRFITILTFVFMVPAVMLGQQTGTIKGIITNADGDPAAQINVGLVGTHLGDATNNDGIFAIQNIPTGEYYLSITSVRFKDKKQLITVEPGQVVQANITLFVDSNKLAEIVVSANKVNKFSAAKSSYVGKMPIARINNPQVYNTITAELLESQVTTSFAGALNNAPGVFKLWGSTGRNRGSAYFSLRGFSVQPTMIDGLPSITSGTLDPAFIKRIEIIKGPSGTLFGSSLISYGGLINIVTKKPYNHFGGELSYTAGTFGLHRVVADINTPLSEEENINARFIGAYHNQNSFQDAGFKNSIFFAPSISYEVNNRLSFLVQGTYLDEESTNPPMVFLNRSVSLEYKNLSELSYNYKNALTSNDIVLGNETFHLQAQVKYKLTENWMSRTSFSGSKATSKGYYTYVWDLQPYNHVFARYVSHQDATNRGIDIQQNFIGSFSIGPVHNKMVVGFDYFRLKSINNNTGYAVADKLKLSTPDTNSITLGEVRSALANVSVLNSTTLQQTYSAYISDVIKVTPQLSAMASLRIDHFVNEGDVTTAEDDYTQTAFSPKFGIIYQPIDNKLSLFANYMNGFSNVAPRVQGDGSIRTFEPEHADQWETGVKVKLLNGRVRATVSYYDITVTNVVRPDPQQPNFYVQNGKNYSHGIEFSISAAPIQGLNLIAGYSYNESKIVKSANPAYQGRRPEGAGPQHLANFWMTYRFHGDMLDGLGFGFGGNYASKNLILNRATTGVFKLPSFTVFNASIFYNTDQFRIDLKVNNLTDEIYYKGWNTINPQEPRSMVASFTYKF